MAIKNINKGIFTQYGMGDPIICPSCKKTVNMSIFENACTPFEALVTGKKDAEYFAVCPSCAASFLINPNYIKERSSGTTVYMTESDLIKKEKSDKNV